MTKPVFISYRRGDVDAEARGLRDALQDALGDDSVFFDVSGIEPGDPFPARIEGALDAAAVVLVAIGPKWLAAVDGFHRRRIDSPEDWVHREVLAALHNAHTIVIPVLLENTPMPPKEALPDALKGLAECQAAVPIRTDHWELDTGPLIKRVAKLCGIEVTPRPERPSSSVPLKYFDWVKDTCGSAELLGLETPEAHAGRLRHVYVPAVTDRTRDLQEESVEGDDNPDLLLNILGEHSAYVPGAPGAGKSTFCRWLAWTVANGAVPSHNIAAPEGFEESLPPELSGKVPLLVVLRDFWSHLNCGHGVHTWSQHQLEDALAAWLDVTRPGGLSGAAFRQQLAAGKAVLAFDGVDEVPDAHRADGNTIHPRACLLSGLADALGAWHAAGNRVVITSRPYGLSDAEVRRLALPVKQIAPLPTPLQHLFIERWYAATDGGQRDKNVKGLKAHLAGRDDLDELTQNPLLLTALCIRFGQGQRLPDDLYDLYEGLVSSVLYSRYEKDPAERDLVRSRLSAIAYGMSAGLPERPRVTPEARVHNEEVDEHLREFANINTALEVEHNEPVQRRKSLLARSGLLESADADNVQFYHLSFQEFLGAAHMLRIYRTDEALLKALRKRGVEKGWRPTLLFLFSGLVKRDPQRALELLTGFVPDLTRERVRENPSLAAFVGLCAEVLVNRKLALGLLAEALTQVFLDAIEDEVEVKDRHVLGLVLGMLGDPRIVPAKDPSGFVEIPAGEYKDSEGKKRDVRKAFQIGRYPVTNGQFREFIEAGGYTNVALWSQEGAKWLRKKKVTLPRFWSNARYNGVNQPVVGVSYWEAEAYCTWVGGRLPTVDEWGAAAGGASGHEYPWGGDWEDGICNTTESGLDALSSVGIFPRSRQADFGLEDLAGNVWEWCPAEGDSEWCVLRGGSWVSNLVVARAVGRSVLNPPRNRNGGIGFRVVLCSPIS